MRAVTDVEAFLARAPQAAALEAHALTECSFILRKAERLGLPQNWQGNCSLPRSGYDDELMTLDLRAGEPSLEQFWKPEEPRRSPTSSSTSTASDRSSRCPAAMSAGRSSN
jgi:hypothetical protein